jgi:hypothetical protein
MKKIMILGAFALVTLASCKKDYTCECTTKGFDPIVTSTTINGKKKDVTTACENGSSSVGSISTVCKIK